MEQLSSSINTGQRSNLAAAGPKHVSSQVYDDDAYKLWHNLQRCPEFNECRREIFACIKAPADVFTYFYYLRINPKAREFTDALHMSIQFVPPERVWDAIVQIRSHPKYSSIRNLVLSEMSRIGNIPSQQTVIKRDSSNSQRSWAHLSAISSNSATTSGISSNTNCTSIEEVEELDTARCYSSGEKVLPELPMAPGKGYRKAPAGHCFVCPLKECKGKWAYKRSGDFLNHMRNVHPSFPPHDASNFLQKDLRVSTTLIEVTGQNMEGISATTAPDSPNGSYPDLHALSDAPNNGSEASVAADDFDGFDESLTVDFAGVPNMVGTYDHHEVRPFFGEVAGISQFASSAMQQQQQSFFYHDERMETG